MKTPYFSFMFVLFLVATSCVNKKESITNPTDYNQYLYYSNEAPLKKINSEKTFWKNKLAQNPTQFTYLQKIAALNEQLFAATAKIDYLIAAEKNLLVYNQKSNEKQASSLRALARNYISQHRFKEALVLLKKAEINGEKLAHTQKMLFDVHLELGNIAETKKYLSLLGNQQDFDYFIRLSKWNDHQGNLTAAIKYLETATKLAEKSKDENLRQWSYTNLADYYGHHNDLKKSYEYYLKALALNPNDSYALKGIAWIVYSYEKNPEQALKIISEIAKNHPSPEYELFQAEIHDFLKQPQHKKIHLENYQKSSNNTMYGVMYQKYNALLYCDEWTDFDKAISLAKDEINNRPTAQSYDLLAWAYFKKGETKKALKIVKNNLAEKTFEPEAQYHMAEIYKANGQKSKANQLKKELLESIYELGPQMEIKIINL